MEGEVVEASRFELDLEGVQDFSCREDDRDIYRHS